MEEFLEGLRTFDEGEFDPSELLTERVQWYQEFNVDAPNKGRFWITDGQTSKMIKGAIPDGWVKGRGKVLSEEGKRKISKLTAERNRNGQMGWTYINAQKRGSQETSPLLE